MVNVRRKENRVLLLDYCAVMNSHLLKKIFIQFRKLWKLHEPDNEINNDKCSYKVEGFIFVNAIQFPKAISLCTRSVID